MNYTKTANNQNQQKKEEHRVEVSDDNIMLIRITENGTLEIEKKKEENQNIKEEM